MIVKRVRDTERVARSGDLFIGAHDYRSVVGNESAQFRMSELTFRDGARTKLHVHDSEQVILVTAGEGIIGNADAGQLISVGDIALISPSEPHWHGVPPGGGVTQWSILGPHSTRKA